MDFDRVRTSEELDLDEVGKYFESLGYSNPKLFQNWRHVTGTMEKDGSEVFLKLASTVEVSEWTRNEYSWNKLMNSLPEEDALSLNIPESFEEGEYEGRFWFTSEYVTGGPIAESDNEDTSLLEELLPAMAKVTYELNNLKLDEFLPKEEPKETEDEGEKVNPAEQFLKRLQHWMGVSDYVAQDLYDRIEKFLREHGREMVAVERVAFHGDFVPWHVFKDSSGELYLIDGEHAKTKGLKFYDLAYFYHRVYTKMGRPDLADRYLEEFNKLYSFSELEKGMFLAILAQRTIGGYFDVTRDKITKLEYQHQLKDKILAEDFVLN